MQKSPGEWTMLAGVCHTNFYCKVWGNLDLWLRSNEPNAAQSDINKGKHQPCQDPFYSQHRTETAVRNTAWCSWSSLGSAKRNPLWGCCADRAETTAPKLLAEDIHGGSWNLIACNFLFDHQTPLSHLGCRQLWQTGLHWTLYPQRPTLESRSGKNSPEEWEVA